ncbi:hypothetical protein [Nocardia brasiliensis]|uniref:hypothetical protein n=1 Tax=Nocardia brasiliensis TaxID=37326 RepID=UPI0024571ADC|nr:hypothetical protein [Nocardia brasiliensis]
MIETETTRQRLSGDAASLEWVDSYHEQAQCGEALETVAAAGGVPLKWIAHVHDRGRAGLRWRTDQYLPEPEPVDWDCVLGALSADVARLQQWTALDVSFCIINPGVYRRVADAMERNLRVLRARTTGVANLLGVDREVGHQLWGTTADWASAGADAIGWLSHQAVADRWTVAAHSDTRDYLRQTYALHVAGIDTINTVALASAPELAAAIRPLVDSSAQQRFRQATAGEEIELALTAAAPPSEFAPADRTHTGATLFSAAVDAQPSCPGPDADREIPLPRFSSAVEGAEP